MFLKLLNTDAFKFIFTKYFAYGLQFITAILIAKNLGVYYFGIYGFVNLLLQYLSYSNLGVNHSLNVILSTEANLDKEATSKLLYAAIHVSFFTGAFLFVVAILNSFLGVFDIFNKYLLKEYYLLVVLIAILQYLNSIFMSLFRIFGRLFEININLLLIPLIQFLTVFFFFEQDLFWALLVGLIISNLISLLFYIYKSPIKVKFNFHLEKNLITKLLKRGISLLFYNLSFYMIVISARSIVSYFYSVEEFAMFNFANSLTHAIIMLIGAFNFLFYPKMINKFSKIHNNSENIAFLEKVRKIYLTIITLVIFASLLVSPLIYIFIPNYADSFVSLKYLLISQLIISNSFGYSTLLVQRQKEKKMILYGFISIGIVFVTGVAFALFLNLPFHYIAISVIFGVLIYNFLVVSAGNKITNQFPNFGGVFLYIYNFRFTTPILLYIALGMSDISNAIASAFSLIVFGILNFNNIIFSFNEGKLIILKKDAFKVL